MPEQTGQIYIPPRARGELLAREMVEAAKSGRPIRTPDGHELLLVDTADPLVKAMQDARAAKVPYRVNPTMYSFGAYKGVKDLPQAIQTTVGILRQVPLRNPVVAAIIQRRKMQVSHYTRRPRFEGDTGFKVVMRGQNKNKKPTAEERKRMAWIEDLLIYGGIRHEHPRHGKLGAWNHEGTKRASGMAQAFQALLNDSLTLDAAAIEIQPGQNSRRFPIAYWEPVDAGNIRFAQAKDTGKDAIDAANLWQDNYRNEIRPAREDVAFVKIDAGGSAILAEYTDAEMAYLVRNPRTDDWAQGYGWSEIERLIEVIKGLLYGVAYNNEFFDNNHIPAGILSLKGNYSDEVLDDFRLQLQTMVGGLGQYWGMPILAAPEGNGAQYVTLRQDASGGMYWKEWILFCAAISGALYGMDAGEINMTNFGQSANALGQGGAGDKIEAAQESGFESMLGTTGSWIDTEFVERVDPDFAFEWTGLQTEDATQKMEESEFRLQMGLSTPNRERARMDEPPLYDPLDQEMWDAIQAKIEAGDPDHELTAEETEEAVVKLYRKAGGQFAKWPDAPVNCAGALQVWMSEHQMDQGAGGAAPGMGGDPNDPNAQQGAVPGAPPPPGTSGFGQPAGVPPPAGAAQPGMPQLAEGDRTHVNDVGAMMLRGNPQPAPAPAQMRGVPMKKGGVLHVTIAREDLER